MKQQRIKHNACYIYALLKQCRSYLQDCALKTEIENLISEIDAKPDDNI